jgi:hypothetical protein
VDGIQAEFDCSSDNYLSELVMKKQNVETFSEHSLITHMLN